MGHVVNSPVQDVHNVMPGWEEFFADIEIARALVARRGLRAQAISNVLCGGRCGLNGEGGVGQVAERSDLLRVAV
eukprot:6764887-Pyramimonas_sp.AAC.1